MIYLEKPVIGIVGRFFNSEKSSSFVYEEYRLAILKSGGIPFLILPSYFESLLTKKPFYQDLTTLEKHDLEKILSFCDGFLFPGGNFWYGFDQFIYSYAYTNNKPVLGICLGMQLIANSLFYEEENSDTTIEINSFISHQSSCKYVHEIYLVDSKLKEILGTSSILVNSRHSSSIQPNESFLISSYSKDGVIESIEIPEKNFILGVQWHPESIYDIDFFSQKLFNAFITACINN